VDPSRLTFSALDELRQIRADIRFCNSLDLVRRNFDRLQELRRQHVDDFDLQIAIADAQQEVIERARAIRKGEVGPADQNTTKLQTATAKPLPDASSGRGTPATKKSDDDVEAAEIPPEVPKLDRGSWRVVMALTIVFTLGLFAAFFYMIQAARRVYFSDEQQTATAKSQPAATTSSDNSPAIPAPVSDTHPPAPDQRPTLRLYTDLTGGTATIDDQPAKDLVDGELNLDALLPGSHSVRVESRSGSADFNFEVEGEQGVPRVTRILKSTNAMVVLVSVKDGIGRLNTDAAGAEVTLDEKPVGSVGLDGLLLPDLGKQDHDLQVSQAHDHQKFVLTYTAAPTLTVFVKSDPSTGVVTVSAGQDGVSVFINGLPYRRLTEHGEIRIPLKVGTYRIRVHKDGMQDPPESLVEVKKNAESSVQFHMQPASDVAMLLIKGAQPGTATYLDHQLAATVGLDGTAKLINIKPGDHAIELRHDQALPKQLTRTFSAGQTVVLTGADAMLDHYAADNKSIIPAAPGPTVVPAPEVPQLLPAAVPASAGEQVHRGGGFIPYHTPKLAGRYYFEAHAKLGGVLKRSKLQWYAGYKDSNNYFLFSLDGKHAEVKEVRDGKPIDLGKTSFNLASDQWVQIEMSVKADTVQARAKAGLDDWIEFTPVSTAGRDFTKENVGIFVPSNEEVAVANFHFTGK
jgi:hypothetical protein